jgi:hypothetical protein
MQIDGLEPAVDSPGGGGQPRFDHTAVDAAGRRYRPQAGAPYSRTWLKLRVVADAFEQELLTDIAEAEAIGENGLAAEWRLELKTYRAAKKQAILEEQALGGSSTVTRREALGRRGSDQP